MAGAPGYCPLRTQFKRHSSTKKSCFLVDRCKLQNFAELLELFAIHRIIVQVGNQQGSFSRQIAGSVFSVSTDGYLTIPAEDETPLFRDDFGEEKPNLDFDPKKYDRYDRGETDQKLFSGGLPNPFNPNTSSLRGVLGTSQEASKDRLASNWLASRFRVYCRSNEKPVGRSGKTAHCTT
eukprot:scaffold1630_cov360-Pavlova_lutheri.AAC.1